MLSQNDARKRTWALLAEVAVVLVISGGCASLETVDGQHHACGLQPIERPSPEWPNAPLTHKPRAKRNPRLSFDVLEDGSVDKVKLLRSSNVPKIDKAVVNAVKKWKYEPSPGCGIRRVELTVAIDPR